MDINVTDLANQAIEVVKPAIVAAGGKAAEAAIAKAGEAAGKVYVWLKSKLTRPAAAAALKEATEHPQENQNWEELGMLLASLLKDKQLREELIALLGEPAAGPRTTQKATNIGNGNIVQQISGKGNSATIASGKRV
jgi:hypothetical protein